MNAGNILLVEGEADRGFFEVVCRQLDIQADVKVAAPRDLTGKHNSKEGVINYLPTLLNQLADGQLERLAVIVDADSSALNGGFLRTRDRLGSVVSPFGYLLASGQSGGLVFEHTDGLADLGLWVMPNNADDGTLEDWMKESMLPDEGTLLTHAVSAIDTIPGAPKFKAIHRVKAEIATWLAWQEKPGHGLYWAAEAELLDTDNALFRDLARWLARVFGGASR